MNETLQHVHFEFDLLKLAMKLNPGDASAANDWLAEVKEIEATLKNLRVTVTPSVPVLEEVLDRRRDPN